jgi:hypothetical protein
VYSLGRFFIQFYRQDTPFALGLSQAQLLSVLTAMVAVWLLIFQAQRNRRYGPSEPWAMRPRGSGLGARGQESEVAETGTNPKPLTPNP